MIKKAKRVVEVVDKEKGDFDQEAEVRLRAQLGNTQVKQVANLWRKNKKNERTKEDFICAYQQKNQIS